jgi:hypothetical protein
MMIVADGNPRTAAHFRTPGFPPFPTSQLAHCCQLRRRVSKNRRLGTGGHRLLRARIRGQRAVPPSPHAISTCQIHGLAGIEGSS